MKSPFYLFLFSSQFFRVSLANLQSNLLPNLIIIPSSNLLPNVLFIFSRISFHIAFPFPVTPPISFQSPFLPYFYLLSITCQISLLSLNIPYISSSYHLLRLSPPPSSFLIPIIYPPPFPLYSNSSHISPSSPMYPHP